MKRTTLTNHIKAFKREALLLLRFQLASNRMFTIEKLKAGSRSDFADTLLAIKAIENDMLIRISKFDDDTKGVHSFKKAIIEIPSTHPNAAEIKKKIKEFSEFISEVKNIRRHTQLAHLKIGTVDNDIQPRYEFTPVLQMIIDIIDLLDQQKVEYKWSDGRYEKHNLRIDVLKET